MPAKLPANPAARPSANDAETRVMDSALMLFSQKGYDGTSIREIIELAGVTRPVLYYYFENKEELFRRLLESRCAQMTGEWDEAVAQVTGLRDRLKALITTAFRQMEESPEVIRLILVMFFAPSQSGPSINRGKLIDERLRRVVSVMRLGAEAGEVRGADPRALGLAFSGMMDMYLMGKVRHPHAPLTPELGEALVDLFLEGAGNVRETSHLVNPFHE
jgi:TetR/AcrR family transcriptional regulator